jgi:hypothetical protein
MNTFMSVSLIVVPKVLAPDRKKIPGGIGIPGEIPTGYRTNYKSEI